MADKSSIEWTDATWNFVTGCKHISPDCDHCYADALSRRLQAMGQLRYRNGFQLTVHESVLDLPRKWREALRKVVDLHDENPPPLARGRRLPGRCLVDR